MTRTSTRPKTACLLILLRLIAFSLTNCTSEKPVVSAVKAANIPIILISVDTLRSDHLPMYGYTGVQTPALDSFRRDAILFEQAWSHCPMTLPSHVSMLTGLLPTQHHVRNNIGYRFDPSRTASLPAILKQHGYTTGAAVSSFVLRGETGLAGIFDWYEDRIRPSAGSVFIDYQRDGAETTSLAKAWITRNKDKPFFFFLHLYEPHVPYNPPEPFSSRYPNRYDGEIARTDQIVGELLEELERLGIYDRALIVLTSDHGEGLGEHEEEQHSILLYRELIQIPLVLKLPASERGGTSVKSPAQLADIAPTILGVLGIDGPKMNGSSLLDLSSVRPIYAETMYPRIQLGWSELTSVIDYPYQFIESPRSELYDLSRDPTEKNDLVASERRQATRMRTWLATQNVPLKPLEQVDPETAAKLSALGYIGSPATRDGAILPNPRDAIKLLPQMQVAFKLAEGRQSEAVVALKNMLANHPEMVELWVKLAEVYSSMGRFQESANAYQESIRRSPVVVPEYLFSAGEVLIKNRDLTRATQHADLLLSEDPPSGHELMARVALARDDLAGASREAQLAVEADPRKEPKRQLLVAEILQRGEKFDETLKTLDSAEAQAQKAKLGALHRLDFLRGDTLARMNRMDEAEAAYLREISSFPSDSRAYANLAVLYVVEGRSSDAERVFEKLVSAYPSETSYLVAVHTFEVVEDVTLAMKWNERMKKLLHTQ